MIKRKRFSKRAYLQRWDLFGGKCWREKCRADLTLRPWEWGHMIALGEGGRDVIENIAPECADCNRKDSKRVSKVAAKVKRVRARHVGITAKRSRGFRGWRKFNGEIVWRK